ncbi:hypothetical protein QUF90_20665 [Desulfococcaceae bacterium HSG9]|nr:hypothetical protein [Desulfococcaceae bacterium HSG9]
MTEFDQRKQKVNTQYNLNIQSDKPSKTELKRRGKRLLSLCEYQSALVVFKQLLSIAPQFADVQYYIVLAQLKGQRPRLLPLSTIKEIERRLQSATQNNAASSHCFILWAIVKEDYYVLNGLYDTPPTVSELLQCVKNVKAVHINEMLTHIQASNNRIWEWLHSIS